MKNIFLSIILCIVSFSVFSQKTEIKSSTSFGLTFRAYAPGEGFIINEEPVFEFYQSFSRKEFSFLFIKSVDLVDQQSFGNYSLFLGKYQFLKNEKFDVWSSVMMIQSDTDFQPSGDPIFIFQTGISKKYSSHILGLRTSLVCRPNNSYVVNPYAEFFMKKSVVITTEAWIVEDYFTLGVNYKNQLFSSDKGAMHINVRYNYRQGWNTNFQKGLFNMGIIYTLK